MKLVVVESPAKAKTINKYLGGDYTVLASYGHIRDLPPKDGSVRPDEGFAMSWQSDPRSERQIKEIKDALKGADELILATDPEREGDAKNAASLIEGTTYTVASIERKRVRRHPQPPFTTSTLQQEASRKLGMGASKTMQVAQKLYEGLDLGGETVGLITYMRTDGVQMSQESVSSIREVIQSSYGPSFVPDAPREYKTRAKNAQEAHEAIRPTDETRTPKEMAQFLDRDQARLYGLVWKRAVACQMASAELDQTAIVMDAADKRTVLRANGSIIAFEGFLKLYQEDHDDPAADSEASDDRLLPSMKEAEPLGCDGVKPEQHFTQPPPRFTEASLVKRMEELGIGRPSTYASIMQVLQDRDYVRLEKKRFTPEDRGRLVVAFLSNFFERYVQYNFTADLEAELDGIAEGKL